MSQSLAYIEFLPRLPLWLIGVLGVVAPILIAGGTALAFGYQMDKAIFIGLILAASLFTVGIGCTGGRHRSVAIVTELAQRLSRTRPVTVRHRDSMSQDRVGLDQVEAYLRERIAV